MKKQHDLENPLRVKEAVDAYVLTLIEDRIEEAKKLSTNYDRLWCEVRRIYKAGGKRMRPYLTYLGSSAFDNTRSLNDMLPIAAAYELLHVAMLVHDDIIDRDVVRHGQPTINGSYRKIYLTDDYRSIDLTHASNSAALLAGDALISEAYLQLQRIDNIDISTRRNILEQFHQAIFTVIGGELLDTEVSDVALRSIAGVDTRRVAQQKTASYSFIAPLMTGAILSGATKSQLDTITDFAQSVGIGFQYRDDMLGIFGDMQATGKSTYGDIIEGKVTLLTQVFFEKANDAQKEQFYAGFGVRDAGDAVYDSVKQAMINAGVPQHVETIIEEKRAKAMRALDSLSLDKTVYAAFEAIVKKALYREK